MKRYIYIALSLCLGFLIYSCNDTPVGYLDTENASYLPDSMVIRTELDSVEDALRIQNQAPWVSVEISGVLGTEPLVYSIVDVKSDDVSEADLAYFRDQIYILGSGIIYYPIALSSDTTFSIGADMLEDTLVETVVVPDTLTAKGHYLVSIGIQNAGDYFNVVDTVMTIIVE